jgi:hypothetical protein
MTPYPTALTWQLDEKTLTLRAGPRRIEVPPPLATHLRAQPGWLHEPDHDLLLADEQLRRRVGELRRRGRAATDEIVAETSGVAAVSHRRARRSWGRRRGEHRQVSADLRALVGDAESLSEELHRTTGLIHLVRELVIDLDAENGLLGDAARGWRRPAQRPGYVSTYPSEAAFLAADTRRTVTAPWGGTVSAAQEYGDGWRRDEDEPDPDGPPLELAGPWQLRYSPRTGKIYAYRRCHYRPEELWLLGTGFHDRGTVHALLGDLQRRKREPNSLLLAADTVHAADTAAGPHPGGDAA